MPYKLIFFDTETTGNTDKDFFCQIAYKTNSENFIGLYKPPIKIPPEASAVHHITNKIVTDKPSFAQSGDLKKIICTLRLARYLDKEEKIEKYNLQYLRYLLEIEIEATAHDALGDVLVLEKLFERLKNKMQKE